MNEQLGPAPYVSIDLETTGLNPERCQVIEFGAVYDDWVTPVDELKRFHAYVTHSEIVGEPFALAMNHEILRRIAMPHRYKEYKFLGVDCLGGHFHSWLDSVGYTKDDKIIAAGKNFASFDRQFLKRINNFDRPFNYQFHHRTIDPCMLFWNPLTDRVPPDSKTCMERAGIPGDVAHTAVEDALTVVKMVRFGAGMRPYMNVHRSHCQHGRTSFGDAGPIKLGL